MREGLVERWTREASARLGNDRRLIVVSVLLGVGLGLLLHRALVGALGSGDRIAVATAAASRDVLLSYGPWLAIGSGVAVWLSATRSGWSGRRVIGSIGVVAGAVVLLVGELELHVFRTLEQGWPAHDLAWDVVFHLPGEAIAMVGWLMLPAGSAQTGSGTRAPVSAGAER